jgi:hypothetical protein
MNIVTIAWLYVVLMMALAEALSPQGTVLGAVFTFLLYGLMPLSLVLYLMGTPMRRRARLKAEAAELAAARTQEDTPEPAGQPLVAAAPDGRGHAAGDPIAPEGEKA